MTIPIQPDDMAAIQRLIASFTDAEAQLDQAKRRLGDAQSAVIDKVAELRSKVDTPYAPELVAVLRHLYWQQPGIGAKAMSEAAGFAYHAEMLKVMGTCPSGIPCEGCGKDLLRTSRSWRPPYGHLCPACRKGRDRNRDREWLLRSARSQMVDAASVLAAGRDWLAVAALVVAYPPVALGIAQNDEHGMREGIWLGWENGRMVQQELLRSTSGGNDMVSVNVGAARRLIDTADRVVGWDAPRTVEIFSAFTAESAHLVLVRLRRLVDASASLAEERALRAYPDGWTPSSNA